MLSLKDFINDAVAVRLGLFLGKLVTRKAGYKLANWTGAWIAKHPQYILVRGVKVNQWVIQGENLDRSGLEEQTKMVFQSAARSLFDYFHYIRRPEKLFKIISFGAQAQAAFDRINNNQATIVVVPHLSNFDLMGYALALMGIKVQALSYPTPNSAYKMQNKLRREAGFEITPMSLSAFRTAKKRLLDGGSVVSGLDRPIPGNEQAKYQPRFFGRKANLPVIHIRLAKETHAAIFVMGCTSLPNNSYHLECTDPIWVESMDDLNEETIVNAERVLHKAEELISKVPQQWAMFYPVWPEVFNEIPHLLERDRHVKEGS